MQVTRQIRILEMVIRLVMAAAVLSLAIVGGTFSHAQGLPHSHDYQSTTDTVEDSHLHIELADQRSEVPVGIHCGADISAPGDGHVLQCPKADYILQTGLEVLFNGLSNNTDPPPPRSYSIEI